MGEATEAGVAWRLAAGVEEGVERVLAVEEGVERATVVVGVTAGRVATPAGIAVLRCWRCRPAHAQEA